MLLQDLGCSSVTCKIGSRRPSTIKGAYAEEVNKLINCTLKILYNARQNNWSNQGTICLLKKLTHQLSLFKDNLPL